MAQLSLSTAHRDLDFLRHINTLTYLLTYLMSSLHAPTHRGREFQHMQMQYRKKTQWNLTKWAKCGIYNTILRKRTRSDVSMSLVGYTGFSSFIKSFWYRLWHHYLVARSRSKCCRHSFIKVWVQSTAHLQLFPILHSINVFNNNNNMSLNSFIRKRLATKSTDCESDFVRGRRLL